MRQIEANNQPSYPRRNLMEEMDAAAKDSAISRRKWADDLN